MATTIFNFKQGIQIIVLMLAPELISIGEEKVLAFFVKKMNYLNLISFLMKNYLDANNIFYLQMKKS